MIMLTNYKLFVLAALIGFVIVDINIAWWYNVFIKDISTRMSYLSTSYSNRLK